MGKDAKMIMSMTNAYRKLVQEWGRASFDQKSRSQRCDQGGIAEDSQTPSLDRVYDLCVDVQVHFPDWCTGISGFVALVNLLGRQPPAHSRCDHFHKRFFWVGCRAEAARLTDMHLLNQTTKPDQKFAVYTVHTNVDHKPDQWPVEKPPGPVRASGQGPVGRPANSPADEDELGHAADHGHPVPPEEKQEEKRRKRFIGPELQRPVPHLLPDVAPVLGCPPGLEYLCDVNQVLVNQMIDLKKCMLPQYNRMLMICQLTGNTFSDRKRDWIPLRRSAELEVQAPKGTVIGSVRMDFSLSPSFSILDRSEKLVLKIKGPLCPSTFCCNDVLFNIFAADEVTKLGHVIKFNSGLSGEEFIDVDSFSLAFPIDLDVKMKAVLLGALILIVSNGWFFASTADGAGGVGASFDQKQRVQRCEQGVTASDSQTPSLERIYDLCADVQLPRHMEDFLSSVKAFSLERFKLHDLPQRYKSSVSLRKIRMRRRKSFLWLIKELEVQAPKGTVIGSVRMDFSLSPSFSILDRRDKLVLKIKRPLCPCTCCGKEVLFNIFAPDGVTKLGHIIKLESRLSHNKLTSFDSFSLGFPIDLDVKMKAVLLGALMLIVSVFQCLAESTGRIGVKYL
ncbi:hypothetical protein HPB48_009611 [Haemaphysalis longicornis]|uniref:Phospholipid scramblase n=1 Tax=Haemaphysalis longicornis TaxID=44386 RepID=A0A9J6FTW2_HAELO|nr:hypothetical protein HPB48_009611 [Haemaphysalis longicornis]